MSPPEPLPSGSVRFLLNGQVKTVNKPVQGIVLHRIAGFPATLTSDGQDVPNDFEAFDLTQDQEFTATYEEFKPPSLESSPPESSPPSSPPEGSPPDQSPPDSSPPESSPPESSPPDQSPPDSSPPDGESSPPDVLRAHSTHRRK